MLAGDTVGASSWSWMLAIRPWASTGSSTRNRCAPRTDMTNATRSGRVLVTDTRRSRPAPASVALTAAGGCLARNAGAKWARSAAAGIGSLPSAWKNHRACAPAGVPGNAGPEPADDPGLPPHPASTTMTAAARTADRRHPGVLDRSRPLVSAPAGSGITAASAPSPGTASLGSLITPSPSYGLPPSRSSWRRRRPRSPQEPHLPGGDHVTPGRSVTEPPRAAPSIRACPQDARRARATRPVPSGP